MKCRKVWSNKAYFEYERNWEKLTWNIKQSYSGLFPIWIGLQRWMDPQQCMRREKVILDILQQLVSYVFVEKVLESMICLVHWCQLTNRPKKEIPRVLKFFSLIKFPLLKTMIFQMMMIITLVSSFIGCLAVAEIRSASRGRDKYELNIIFRL